MRSHDHDLTLGHLEPRDRRGPEAELGTPEYNEVMLAGMRVAVLDRLEVEELICNRLRDGRGGWLVTANLEYLRQIRADPVVRGLVSRADVVVADGMPLVWAASLVGRPLRERVAGSDLIWTLSRRAATMGLSVYLLGGPHGAAQSAADKLERMYDGLRVCGAWAPEVARVPDRQQAREVAQRLADARADIVFVGLGFPKQDLLIDSIRDECPGMWFVGCGVSIEFAAGLVPRAPMYLQRVGLEWVYRLRQEPRKLFARYIIHDVPFAFWLIAWAIGSRIVSLGMTRVDQWRG
jgi:N-acetylglucosaminyldiphosphoundecaprenol N-acetyl-beta-D-mannosaminyltransferase